MKARAWRVGAAAGLVLPLALLLFATGLAAQDLSLKPLDPRGPLAGSEGKVRIDAAGIEYTAAVTAPPATGEWTPSWIWLATSPNGVAGAHFRREFQLREQPARAVVQISADRIYRLWVNGRLVSRGPDDPGFDEILSQNWSHHWLYNSVDIAPWLRAGANVIAAEVLTSARLPGYSLHHAGFAFHASFERSGGTPLVIDSDTSWQAQPATAYGEGEMPASAGAAPGRKPEIGITYDARNDDPQWRSAGAAKDWPSAAAIAPVWGTLSASRVPQRMEASYPAETIRRISGQVQIKGTKVFVAGDGAFNVDYNRVLSAYASFSVRGAAGTLVTIQPSETKTGNPRRSAQVTLRDGVTYFEHPAYDAFSTIRVIVTHATGPLEFDDVGAVFTSDPVSYAGSFHSSDAELDKLWAASRWLTQICMQDHYLDSPNHQEPIGDFGDYLIEAVENDYAFDQQALTRQDLSKFGEILDHSGSVNFHTSYSLLWLQMLLEYYQHTGDRSLLLREKPTVDRLLAHFATFRGANGLLSEAPNYMFMDWVTISGFPTHHPPAVIGQGYLTAFYYRALADGASIAALAGDRTTQALYERERAAIALAFNHELWDAAAGLYRDGRPNQNHQPLGKWLPEDKDIETHSVHVNALAVLYDLAPRDQQASILNKLNEAGPLNVQPYFMHFVFAAEVHAGVFDRWAVSQMRRWTLNPETGTFKEMFAGGDFSHGWGGTPLIQLSSHVLGVAPAAPGFQRMLLAPHPSGLSHAEGTVPTPLGPVQVAWTIDGKTMSVDVTSPSDVPIDLSLEGPLAGATSISIDGKAQPIQPGIALAGGTHHIALNGVSVVSAPAQSLSDATRR